MITSFSAMHFGSAMYTTIGLSNNYFYVLGDLALSRIDPVLVTRMAMM